MNIGQLRHKITFQTVTRQSDGQGGWDETWNDYITVWAHFKTQENVTQSKEPIVGKEKVTQTSYKVTIRYREDLKADMQIKWGERILSIRNILDLDNTRQFLQLFCDDREV